jgi:hypothetical protein
VWGVTQTASRAWAPDVLEGFEQTTVAMPDSWDGPVDIVVVRRVTGLTSGGAVLYVHGFGDYFFQDHLADYFEKQACASTPSTRRHGRAIREHQHPNTCRSIDEYVEDIDAAVELLVGEEGVTWLLLNGHSTGGLAAAIQAHRGTRRRDVDAVYLNSPFLDMNLPFLQEALLEPLLSAVGGVLPNLDVPGLSALYGDSIHERATDPASTSVEAGRLAKAAGGSTSPSASRGRARSRHLCSCSTRSAACEPRSGRTTSSAPTSCSTSRTSPASRPCSGRTSRSTPCPTESTTSRSRPTVRARPRSAWSPTGWPASARTSRLGARNGAMALDPSKNQLGSVLPSSAATRPGSSRSQHRQPGRTSCAEVPRSRTVARDPPPSTDENATQR